MKLHVLLVAGVLSGTAIAACSDSNGGNTKDAGASGVPNLPCDVQTLLQTKCQSCHGNPPIGGAPMALVTHADLTAASTKDPKLTNAQIAVQRMQDSVRPMPPDGTATPDDVATLQKWIDAQYPKDTCAGVDAAPPNPYDTPTVCTSGLSSSADIGRELMHPGGMCNTCHAKRGVSKRFTIAGTVYPTAHEPDDCYGSSGSATGAKVQILDMDGNVQLTLTPNARGNFYSSTTIKKPFTAKVVVGDQARVMTTPQTDGECNSCHTETGTNDAPGRIMLP